MPINAIIYKNTIIYKIVCNDLNIKDIYVGYTTNFNTRRSHHKVRCNNPNDAGYEFKIYKVIRDNGGWNNWSMIEIEKFPCNDSNEARARERYWYEVLNANLNTDYPNRTEKEYRESNRETIKERQHDRYIRNREEDLKQKNKIIQCECGSHYTYSNKNKHIKQSKKHIEYITNQQI